MAVFRVETINGLASVRIVTDQRRNAIPETEISGATVNSIIVGVRTDTLRAGLRNYNPSARLLEAADDPCHNTANIDNYSDKKHQTTVANGVNWNRCNTYMAASTKQSSLLMALAHGVQGWRPTRSSSIKAG